jgi:broad specificity phosphatase PhoE
MELYLIRHADMAGDPHRHYAPPVSGCLSEEGCRQAAALGRALAGVGFSALYASPLGRAVQTAQAVLEAQPAAGLTLGLLPWLVEWKPATALGECDEIAYAQILARMGQVRPEQSWKTPAGEGTFEMAHRIIPGFLTLMGRHGMQAGHGGYLLDNPQDRQRIALVGHGGSLGLLAGFLLGIPLKPHGAVALAHTGLMVFGFMERVDVWYPVLQVPAPPTQ